MANIPYFHVPLNIPHAATIASRIKYLLTLRVQNLSDGKHHVQTVLGLSDQLFDLLIPYKLADENPPTEEAERVRTEAARLGRSLVDEIESLSLGEDRLGQCIRNLFECLEMGEEGATISLRAGENPNSALRPI